MDLGAVRNRCTLARALRISEERFLVRFGLIVLPVAVLLVGLGCGEAPLTGVSVDPGFRRFLAPGAKALLSMDLTRLKKTALYKRHEQELAFPQLNALAERTGLDPRRDLAALLVSWDGSHPLILVRGTFTDDKLKQQLGSMGARPTLYKAHTLFGAQRDWISFPENGLAVAGSEQTLKGALDSRDAGSGRVQEDLEQRLRAIPKGSQAWEASTGGLPFAEIGMRSDLESALSNISGYVSGTSAGVNLASGANVQAEIVCVSNEGAQRVHDALRGVIGLARLSTETSKLDLLRMWDAVHVDQDGPVVHVRADLPADLVDKLIAELPKLKSRI
jgi:hypothetical protein